MLLFLKLILMLATLLLICLYLCHKHSLDICHWVLGVEPESSAKAAKLLTAEPSPQALASAF